MRKPRDLADYVTRREAIKFLRALATNMEKEGRLKGCAAPLVKIRTEISYWDPTWEKLR